MKKNAVVAVVMAFVSCYVAFPVSAQTAPEGQGAAAAPPTNPFADWAKPKSEPTESPPVNPPVLAASYSGRWEIPDTRGGTNSNTTSFTITAPFQLEDKGRYYVAKGTFTMYPTAYNRDRCSINNVNIPMEIRWYPMEGEAFNLIATSPDTACSVRQFRLVRDTTSGRLISKRGQELTYYDPEKN